MSSSSPQVQQAGQQAFDDATAAAGLTTSEDGQLETGAAPMQLQTSLGDIVAEPMGGPRLAREYVWGPGDSWGPRLLMSCCCNAGLGPRPRPRAITRGAAERRGFRPEYLPKAN